MFKIKLLAGLAVVVTALVAMTVPAMAAEFESNSSSNQGKVIAFPEKSVFTATPGNPSIECKSAGGPIAEWVLPAKKSATELLQIKKWGTCVGPTSLPATVKCNLEVNASNNTGSVPSSGCSVLVGSETGNHCIVKVASTGNKELAEVKVVNVPANKVELESNVAGITSTFEETPAGECTKTLGLKAGKEGTFKSEGKPLVTEGQKV